MAASPVPDADPVDAILQVMDAAFDPAFGEAWNRRQVSDALLLGTCRHRLITPSGRLADHLAGDAAGFYLARGVLDEEELLLLAVAPEFRRRGLGALLLDDFLQSCRRRGARRAFLEMRRGNPAAALYEKNRFRSVGSRPGYYRGNDGTLHDALSLEHIFG